MRILILNNVRSSENVGSLLRTADAFNIDTVYLCGYTPTPIDRFGRSNTKVTKAALGAESSVVWQSVPDVLECCATLRRENTGLVLIALEQDKRSVPLSTYMAPVSWALVVGNEVEGVEQGVIDMADVVVEIPMQGAKESLNVAVSGGIALYHLST